MTRQARDPSPPEGEGPPAEAAPPTPRHTGGWQARAAPDRKALVVAGVALPLLAIFAVLGSVHERFPGDLAASVWVQSLGSGWLDFVMEAISAPGTSYGAAAAVAIAVLMTFLLRGTRPAGFLLTVATLGVLVRVALKTVIARPRPPEELVRVMAENDGYSFPSGHVMFYVVLLGTLYLLLSPSTLSGRRLRLVQAAIAVALVLIAMSRIYLGVHWLSDVVASYVFGIAVVAVAAWVWRRWSAGNSPTS